MYVDTNGLVEDPAEFFGMIFGGDAFVDLWVEKKIYVFLVVCL